MFIKTYATIYNSKIQNTEKLTNKSLAISDKKGDGTWETEYWTGKFVGKAKETVDALNDKARVLIQGNVHNGYNKDTKQYYPYILVTSVEVVEKGNK